MNKFQSSLTEIWVREHLNIIFEAAYIRSKCSLTRFFTISYRAPYSNWQFDLTPLWASINGNTISDVDLRASYRTGRTNFFVGARAMETGGQLINGPYIGVGFNF
jgi:hypothetical protein